MHKTIRMNGKGFAGFTHFDSWKVFLSESYLDQYQNQNWTCPHKNEWENSSQTPVSFEIKCMLWPIYLYSVSQETLLNFV